MNKNVQIKATVTSMSKALDAIACKVIAGDYTTKELQEKLSSVANVLVTTASAQKHILGQVKDVDSFATVASTNAFDDTLSVVLSTQAQAQLIGQMIKGELGITAEDEVMSEENDENENDIDDSIEDAVNYEEEEEALETESSTNNVVHNLAKAKMGHASKLNVPKKNDMSVSKKSYIAPKVKSVMKTKSEDLANQSTLLEEQADLLEEQGLTAQASKIRAIANELGQGVTHTEINPDVVVVEKEGANDVPNTDGNAPKVKTSDDQVVASTTAMSSSASARSAVVWNFN